MSSAPTNYPSFQMNDGGNLLNHTRKKSRETHFWPGLISKYVEDSITIYTKWLKRGVPKRITLFFNRTAFHSELEPKIYLDYGKDSVFLNYEDFRYGKLEKKSAELQKQCVRAAESDYIEFREAITEDVELKNNISIIAQILEEHLGIPVYYQLIE